MKFFVLLVSLSISLTSVTCQYAHATDPFGQVGAYTLTFLTIPTGPRNVALGQVGAADDADPSNQHYNPATLFTYENIGVNVNYARWPADIRLMTFAANAGRVVSSGEISYRLAGSLLYTALDLNVDRSDTVFLPGGTGGEPDDGDSHVTLALAGGLGTGNADLGLGVAAKRVDSSLAEQKLNAWAFDVGVIGKATFKTESEFRFIPSAGLSILNLGPKIHYGSRGASLPRQIRLGAGLRVEAPTLAQTESLFGYSAPLASVSLVGDFIDDAGPDEAIGGGIELGVIDVLFLRIGRNDALGEAQEARTTYGLGLAWAVSGFRITLDYSNYDIGTIFDDNVEIYGGAITYAF